MYTCYLTSHVYMLSDITYTRYSLRMSAKYMLRVTLTLVVARFAANIYADVDVRVYFIISCLTSFLAL